MRIAETRGMALVTGEWSGIGTVYADRLAQRGHADHERSWYERHKMVKRQTSRLFAPLRHPFSELRGDERVRVGLLLETDLEWLLNAILRGAVISAARGGSNGNSRSSY